MGTLRRRGLHLLHFLAFDRKYARWEPVPSRSSMMIKDLDPVDKKNISLAREYVPSPRLVVMWILDSLGIDFAQFSFVDFGSGKGRVLVAAAQRPFRQVRGVEFSRPLHAIADGQIKQMPRHLLICRDTRSVCCDAVDFNLPGGNGVYYFYNPFGQEVLEQVLSNVVAANKQSGRHALVVLYNPVCAGILENHPQFRRKNLPFLHRLRMWLFSPYPAHVYELIHNGEMEEKQLKPS